MAAPFGRHGNQKRTVLLFFLCAFTVFLMGFLRTTPEFHLYNRQFLQNQIEFSNIKTIFEVNHLKKNLSAVRYNVKDIRNIVPEVRPRKVQTAEQKLFKKEHEEVISGLLNSNWTTWKEKYCSGNLLNFKGSIILMRNVVVDLTKKHSVAQGGEDIQTVIGHSETDEEVNLQGGFFSLPCKQIPKLRFTRKSHFSKWFSGISRQKGNNNQILEKSSFTVLIKRGDYANLYWTLIELYNTYLTIRLFNENPKAADVILMDAHPAGKLDNLWKLMFGNVYRIGQMPKKTFHEKLAWVMPLGPMSQNVKNIPFVEEFKFALYQGVKNSPTLYHKCSDTQNITFILRKDYVAHPRNPSGRVQRKITNEKDVIKYINERVTDAHIKAIQIDLLPIEEQIKLIYETNVLVGVHGAGLGHALLLRSGSTMIELFPSSYKRSPNPHFQQFAYWADVHYDRWFSKSRPQKNNEWIYVEPDVPYKLIRHALDRFCNKKS